MHALRCYEVTHARAHLHLRRQCAVDRQDDELWRQLTQGLHAREQNLGARIDLLLGVGVKVGWVEWIKCVEWVRNLVSDNSSVRSNIEKGYWSKYRTGKLTRLKM